jgi:hypothetical protein
MRGVRGKNLCVVRAAVFVGSYWRRTFETMPRCFFLFDKGKGRPHAGLCVNGPQHFYTSMNQTQKYAAKVLNSLRLEGVSVEMINCRDSLRKIC